MQDIKIKVIKRLLTCSSTRKIYFIRLEKNEKWREIKAVFSFSLRIDDPILLSVFTFLLNNAIYFLFMINDKLFFLYISLMKK